FFQAEDGIRDKLVTGVQTCALPISLPGTVGLIRSLLLQQKFDEANAAAESAVAQRPNSPELQLALGDLQFAEGKIPDAERSYVRSEERRVGKECRSRWARDE